MQNCVKKPRSKKPETACQAKPFTTSAPINPSTELFHHLQRSIGNRALQEVLQNSASSSMISLPLQGRIHPVAASLNEPGVRFRVPEFDRIKAAYTDKDLKIPEAVIKDRVAQLLGRMAKEGRLKSTDPISVIIGKIFPGPGKIDETEFNNAVDVTDRSKIYQNVFDANTTIKTADKPKLKTAIKDSIDIIKKVEGDTAGLTAVFGTKDNDAKTNYAKVRGALDTVSKDMDTHITTDYNLDDPEVGLGGWANFSSKHIHLLGSVAKVTNPDETKITLIHEASHLADSTIDDQGYYGSKGFEAMTEIEKLGNAAHYEELPRRELGKSSYVGVTFKPGVTVSGGVVTREDQVKRDSSEYMRKAWDAAVDTHSLIRGLRQAYLKGNNAPFATHKVLIMKLSKLMDMDVHEQAAGKEIITTLDVTISESVARAVSLIWRGLRTVPFPNPVGTLTDIELRDKIIDQAIANYGNLLKDAKRDRDLIDWFNSNYRKVPGI